MSPRHLPSPPVAATRESSLDPFFARIASTNPFTDNRSSGPSARDIDVENIHGKQFERLVALAREAHEERRGLGAMVLGEAGIGKSHLLARFARWAEQEKHACLVYLHNLQARPENLPRSLLKSVFSILTRGQIDGFCETPFFRLVNALMREALQYDPNTRYTWDDLESAYGGLVDRLSTQEPWRAALVDRTVYDVVRSFFRSAYRAREGADDGSVARFALRWLAGDALDTAEAARLGLPPNRCPDEPAALADDEQIKHVLVALCRMASSRRQPFVLCFDQVDNLDTDQAAALARFLAALLDSATNLLVVVSGIQATLLQWRGHKVIQDSAWDRLAQLEITLQRSSVSEGCAIVTARLQRFLEPDARCDAVNRRWQEDPLFPLGKSWAEAFLKDKVEVRPRDVLSWAREGWRREQAALRELGGPAWLARWGSGRPAEPAVLSSTPAQIQDAIDAKVAQKFAEHKAQREVEPHTLPPNAANLAGLLAALLEHCVPTDLPGHGLQVEQLSAPVRGKRPVYDLIVHQRRPATDAEVRAGLCFLTTGSAQSATAALRRLLHDPDPPPRVFLITDERTSLPLGPIGMDYYEELRQRGDERFRHIELTFAQYAQLDALQATVGLARAGDLEIELPGAWTRPVSPPEVIASQQRQGRYASAPILSDLLADMSAEPRQLETARDSAGLLGIRSFAR
jgi:hypothetical protein